MSDDVAIGVFDRSNDMREVHCSDCGESFGEFVNSLEGVNDVNAACEGHKKKCPGRCPQCGRKVSAHTMDNGEGGIRLYCP